MLHFEILNMDSNQPVLLFCTVPYAQSLDAQRFCQDYEACSYSELCFPTISCSLKRLFVILSSLLCLAGHSANLL